ERVADSGRADDVEGPFAEPVDAARRGPQLEIAADCVKIIEQSMPVGQPRDGDLFPLAHVFDRLARARSADADRFMLDAGVIRPFPVILVLDADVGRKVFRTRAKPADDRAERGAAGFARNRSPWRFLPRKSAVEHVAR